MGNGSFVTPKPSFPDFGDCDPCKGRTRSQEKDATTSLLKEVEGTIPFKIIIRMKLLFSNYLGDYSYSFQGSSK